MLIWSAKTLLTVGESFQLLKTCVFSIRDTSETYQMMKTRCRRQTLKTVRSIGTRSLVILLYSVYTLFSIFRNLDPVFQDLRLVVKAINAYLLNILEVRFWIQGPYAIVKFFQIYIQSQSSFTFDVRPSSITFFSVLLFKLS
jgi:hypothetical protein